MRKVVLITGGAGFLGSHLADVIVARGDDVIIADNLSTGAVSNVEAALAGGHATFVYADVARPAAELREVIVRATRGRKLDMIFHFASPAGPEAYATNQWQALAVNSIGTMSLIEVACEHSARFIYASTAETAENAAHQMHPGSHDVEKRFGEAAVAAGIRTRGLDGRIVRFVDCYGPRMPAADGRLVPSLIDAALAGRPLPIHGTGRQTQWMTYVEDAISLLLSTVNDRHDGLEPVTIGSGEESTVEDVARAIASASGTPFTAQYLPAREDALLRRAAGLGYGDGSGWRPTTSMAQGLQRTFDWFALHRAVYA